MLHARAVFRSAAPCVRDPVRAGRHGVPVVRLKFYDGYNRAPTFNRRSGDGCARSGNGIDRQLVFRRGGSGGPVRRSVESARSQRQKSAQAAEAGGGENPEARRCEARAKVREGRIGQNEAAKKCEEHVERGAAARQAESPARSRQNRADETRDEICWRVDGQDEARRDRPRVAADFELTPLGATRSGSTMRAVHAFEPNTPSIRA